MTEIALSLSIVVGVAMIVGGLIYGQKAHYDFMKSQKEVGDVGRLSDKLMLRLQEFDDYKKKVDALVMKAGFKL